MRRPSIDAEDLFHASDATLAPIAEHAIHSNCRPKPRPARQEWLENQVNRFE